MIADKIVSTDELRKFGAEDGDYAGQGRALLAQQKTVWEQLARGFKSLDTVRVRKFRFDGFDLNVQFNPGRIISSAAKVDEKSIKERKCFLCVQNLPREQRGIAYGLNYLILCNPFPIFPEHFTIPHIHHVPQRIDDAFEVLLDLSEDLGKYYTVFYNGPKCGASAPDHLHFQAGNKGFMLIEDQHEHFKRSFGAVLHRNTRSEITAIDDGLRRFITIETHSKHTAKSVFNSFYELLTDHSNTDEEPMMNIISLYDTGREKWRVLLIPRAKHRPSFYFKEGSDKILLSPAAVDFGGVLITPVEKDFNLLTGEHIKQMFKEVSLDPDEFRNLIKQLQQKLEDL